MRASLRVARFDAGARAERQRHGGAAACGAPSRPISRSVAGAVPTVERLRALRASRTRTAPRSSRAQPRATAECVPVIHPADPGCEATRARVWRRERNAAAARLVFSFLYVGLAVPEGQRRVNTLRKFKTKVDENWYG